MHSRIFELSSKPVELDERYNLESMPDSFFDTIADYGRDIEEEERNRDIDWFVSTFHGLATRTEDRITFDDEIREKFFQKAHTEFVAQAAKLAACTYEAFCGKDGHRELEYELFRLNDAYEDKYGFYAYDPESCDLQPLHAWLREADLTKPWYVGGVVDYHW